MQLLLRLKILIKFTTAMRIIKPIVLHLGIILLSSCDLIPDPKNPITDSVNFQLRSSINVGGATAAEISAYDVATKKLFVVNVESAQISVFLLTDLDNPVEKTAIDVSKYGVPNSVAVHDGKLAIAVECDPAQNPGFVLLYNTADQKLEKEFKVGALADMVTFTKDGSALLSANEGEPNDDYSVDPNGSVSIITLADYEVTTLDFTAFNGQEAALEEDRFRVFGPNASLAQDVEPEYIATSEDAQTA